MLRVFARRHRALVMASAVALVMLIAGAATTAWQAARARRSELIAIQQRNEFRNLTLDAIKRLEEATGSFVGSMDTKRRLIDAELAGLNQLMAHAGHDPELAIELAEVYLKIAGVQGNLQEASEGDLEGAVENIGKALSLLENPKVAALDVDRVQDLLTGAYFRAGVILLGADRCVEAAGRFGQSADVAATRALVFADDIEQWARAADPMMWQIRALMRADHESEAREVLRDLVDWTALAPDPWDDWGMYQSGAIKLTLGIAHMEVADFGTAVAYFDEQREVMDGMEKRDSLVYQLTRGDCERYQARAMERLGRSEMAVEGYRSALWWYQLALQLEPNARATNHIAWFTRMLLADALAEVGAFTEANRAAAEGVAAAERDANADPGSDSSLIRLAGAVLAQGRLLTRSAEAVTDEAERMDLAAHGTRVLERALRLSKSVRAKAMIESLGGATEERILEALERNRSVGMTSTIEEP
jgi:tetratricopeptide (TPR) repeat protein